MTSNPYFDEAIASAKKGFAMMLGYDVEPTPQERELAARGMCCITIRARALSLSLSPL